MEQFHKSLFVTIVVLGISLIFSYGLFYVSGINFQEKLDELEKKNQERFDKEEDRDVSEVESQEKLDEVDNRIDLEGNRKFIDGIWVTNRTLHASYNASDSTFGDLAAFTDSVNATLIPAKNDTNSEN